MCSSLSNARCVFFRGCVALISRAVQPDALSMLGELTQKLEANIIKLPNISASIPQLNEAIAELQSKGYAVPNFPQNPKTPAEEDAAARYAKVLGSAVNPVIREGNSDRRVAAPVKRNAQRNKPPVRMREWSKDSKTTVGSMAGGDFFGSELSVAAPEATTVTIEFVDAAGTKKKLKDVKLQAGEVIDASVMSVKALRKFFADEIADSAKKGIMLSLHLKATMMKVSDPIIFGHAVSVFLAPVFEKYGELFKQHNVNPRNGLGDMLDKIAKLPNGAGIKAEIDECFAKQVSFFGVVLRECAGLIETYNSPTGGRWWIPRTASPTCMCPTT